MGSNSAVRVLEDITYDNFADVSSLLPAGTLNNPVRATSTSTDSCTVTTTPRTLGATQRSRK